MGIDNTTYLLGRFPTIIRKVSNAWVDHGRSKSASELYWLAGSRVNVKIKIDPGISILAVISACYDIFPIAAWLTSYLFQIFAQVLPSQEGLHWPSSLSTSQDNLQPYLRIFYGHLTYTIILLFISFISSSICFPLGYKLVKGRSFVCFAYWCIPST